MIKGKMVRVEWDDASFNSGYYDKKDPKRFEPVFTATVGHLVKKTRKEILVSQDRFYDARGRVDDDRHIGTIPKKMIRRIVYLVDRDAPH